MKKNFSNKKLFNSIRFKSFFYYLSIQSKIHLFHAISSETNEAKVFQQTNAIASIQLKLSSPNDQLNQLIRILPNGSITGQVMNSQTLNYKTFKPEKGGLFCERIFGPIQDYTCACGIEKKILNSSTMNFCQECEVEYTSSRVRRYRLGFIRLGVPIAHIWYLKGRPSYIALLLDMKKKHAESIAYGATCIFHNYRPEFGLRIQKSRLDFNQRFLELRKASKNRPRNLFKLRLSDKLSQMLQFVDYRSDDFWVHSKSIYDLPYEWTKMAFLRKKPFYQIPLIRDRHNINYRGEPDNLYSIEDYLFSLKRDYGCDPIPKHKKAVLNSMICYDSAREIEMVLTGGLAFLHLFSKIDCHRFEVALNYDLASTRESIIYFNELRYHRKRNKTKLTKQEIKEWKMVCSELSKLAKRVKLFRTFWRTGLRPEWMFISILPVLPPDLRPIIEMPNTDQLAVSDLNRLYQAVFHRNRNMKLAIKNIYINLGMQVEDITDASDFSYQYQAFRFSTSIVCFQQNLLQQAVDALLENGKGGSDPVCGSNNRPLKSLSDILKGKQGRFRQNLLGKRVDYSGRSVIVVGPKLKLYQCGLPKQLALELFQSLVIRQLKTFNLVKNIIEAKHLIQMEHPIIWSLLNDIMAEFPILLNRAPTLHRLGIQAFLPKLVRGKAILLHPLVCPAFNADFDGDQMGVHLPLSIEAKSEAWSLMLSTQNILSPATGDPILTPSQDMVLGCYYLTTINSKIQPTPNLYFANLNDVYKAYLVKQIFPHDFIWLPWKKPFYSTQLNGDILEIRLRYNRKKSYLSEKLIVNSTNYKTYFLQHLKNQDRLNGEAFLKDQFLRTTVGRVILNYEFQNTMNSSNVKFVNLNNSK